MFEYPILLIFPAAMAFAAAMDLVTMTIPNRISLALIAAFALLAPFSGIPWQVLLANHVGAGIFVLAIGVGLFACRTLGGGDAKLLASAALWLGFDNLLPFLLQMAIIGGALSLAVLAYRRFVPVGLVTAPAFATRLHDKSNGIPYGIAIGGAGMLIYPATPWFATFAA